MDNVARSKTTRGEGFVPRSRRSATNPIPNHRIEAPPTPISKPAAKLLSLRSTSPAQPSVLQVVPT